MTFDGATGNVVLFGGEGEAGAFADTWTWDGSSWTQQNPSVSPPGRVSAAMTYDPGLKLVLMWGGATVQGAGLDDFWAWDGSTWKQLQPSSGPPADSANGHRPAPLLTYDSRRKVDVLIRDGTSVASGQPDVWTWNGIAWTQVASAQAPSDFWGNGAYDPSTGAVWMFGIGSSTGPQTWSFDGATWTQHPENHGPSLADQGANLTEVPPAVYSAVANGVVLVGSTGDVFSYDGQGWTAAAGSATLNPGYDYTVAFDSIRAKIVIFGPFSASISEPFSASSDSTFTWDGSSWE